MEASEQAPPEAPETSDELEPGDASEPVSDEDDAEEEAP